MHQTYNASPSARKSPQNSDCDPPSPTPSHHPSAAPLPPDDHSSVLCEQIEVLGGLLKPTQTLSTVAPVAAQFIGVDRVSAAAFVDIELYHCAVHESPIEHLPVGVYFELRRGWETVIPGEGRLLDSDRVREVEDAQVEGVWLVDPFPASRRLLGGFCRVGGIGGSFRAYRRAGSRVLSALGCLSS